MCECVSVCVRPWASRLLFSPLCSVELSAYWPGLGTAINEAFSHRCALLASCLVVSGVCWNGPLRKLLRCFSISLLSSLLIVRGME